MADDHNQRPYRSNVPPARGPSASATPAGNDPLAELARLIGQNDPFAEFGRDATSRAAAPRQSDEVPDWFAQRDAGQQPPAAAFQPALRQPAAPPLADPQQFGGPGFGRQPYGSDLYHAETEVPDYGAPGDAGPGYSAGGVPGYPPGGVPGYAPGQAEAGYEHEPFPPTHGQSLGQFGPDDDEYYDDAPPNRRRLGIIAIAGVFALAVLGTAGAFGYRAIFGSSSSSSPPPVIKAEQAPSKIVPAISGRDAQASKSIVDRVNERGQGEQLVSREEAPIPVTTERPGNIVFPQSQNGTTSGAMASSALPQLGSGVVGADPKRIRTIAIRPDQPDGAAPVSPEPPQARPAAQPQQQPRIINTAPERQAAVPPPQPQRATAAEPAQPPRPAAITRAAPAPAPAVNAPLSLNPNATAPSPQPTRAAAAAPPVRLAPAPAGNGSAGGYAVQVSAQRSEAEAQSALRTLQGRYPDQLGGRQSTIKRVDLGDKGIYFRALVGPFGSSGEASELCASLKAAGGNCLVQKN